MEGVKRFIEALEAVVERMRCVAEKKRELFKLVESFDFPSATLPAGFSRRYVLYEGEDGSIALVIEGTNVEMDVRTSPGAREKLVADTGLPKDYYHWRLANLLLFIKHAGDTIPALNRVSLELSDEEELLKKFLEKMKEFVAIVEMWKLSEEGNK